MNFFRDGNLKHFLKMKVLKYELFLTPSLFVITNCFCMLLLTHFMKFPFPTHLLPCLDI